MVISYVQFWLKMSAFFELYVSLEEIKRQKLDKAIDYMSGVIARTLTKDEDLVVSELASTLGEFS
jgi:hypothetical protein